MTRYLLCTGATIALVAASGAAQAADVPAAVTTIAPIAAPAAQVAIQMDTTARFDWDFDPIDIELDWESDIVVDFQRPGAWSFQLLGILDFYDWDPVEFDWDLAVRAYRGFGNANLGLWAGLEGDPTADIFSFGWDIAFHTGSMSIYNNNYFVFEGGFDIIVNQTALVFAVNERVSLGAGAYFEFPDNDFDLSAWVQLDLGDLQPYAYVLWQSYAALEVGIGVDYVRQIGTGPWSLIANAELSTEGGDLDLDLIFGVRFDRGEVNTPWWWKEQGINGLRTNDIARDY